MQDTLEAPVEAPAESPPGDAFQENVLTALERISASVAQLTDRVQAVEDGTPRFVKATPETYGNHDADAYERYQIAEAAPPDGIPRAQKVPVFSDGQRVPDFVMDQFRPRFRGGQRVRLNLDAVPYGRTDGKTRGELMAEAGVPNGPGEVLDATFLSKKGVWKYRVQFPKQVTPGATNGVIKVYEPELVPA